MEVRGKRGAKPRAVAADEGPWRKDPAKLASEAGRFGGSNSVTAGNASPVSDGAAALVLMSGKKAAELNLPVCSRWSSKRDGLASQIAKSCTRCFPLSPRMVCRLKCGNHSPWLARCWPGFAVLGTQSENLSGSPQPPAWQSLKPYGTPSWTSSRLTFSRSMRPSPASTLPTANCWDCRQTGGDPLVVLPLGPQLCFQVCFIAIDWTPQSLLNLG